MTGTAFTHRIRVRYSECDQQGVVFNGHYLFFYDVAVVELFRARIGSWQQVLERGVDLVVAETRLRYRAPARFDDELDISLPVTHLGTTSLVISPQFHRDGRLLTDGEVRHVFVDPATGQKTPIPEDLRSALSA
ncbi:acyl-CoA thioester hydrolase [Saccharopolyspora antimicrobica]|uniref:Acyl-CoA thioester hydrolase n=1 Tax=Saccharopolyspora antimicrobica TaxID=455193 RepID=A0A1I4QKT7_9PSEU|nr:thioesterase family protein [Saccharopolyspora antimicrobica]RKT88396.1 acyl-CoA thioester hydrolase [Saccharopolyspora antimicrobica]SFM40644.1 acyl-CoA thioester hydrolase [Saccharopolyspora antimicrobica]